MKFFLSYMARMIIGFALMALSILGPRELFIRDIVSIEVVFGITALMVVVLTYWWWVHVTKWAADEMYYQNHPEERPE